MSQARRQRRALERQLGLRKKNESFFSKEARELRDRRTAAGKEIHRQNLEKERNAHNRAKNDKKEESKEEKGNGISLGVNIPDDDLNPYNFLDDKS